MAPLALLACLLAEQTLTLGERRPLLMVVLPAPGLAAELRPSELYRAAAAALRERTALALTTPESEGSDLERLASCPLEERLSCLVRGARSQPRTRYLLVLAVAGAAGRDQLSSLLFDLEELTPLLAGEIPREELEDRIFERAVRPPPRLVAAADAAALAAYFQALFGEELRSMLARSGDERPLGSVSLAAAPPELSIAVDGEEVGVTRGGPVQLSELRPGRRRIRLRAADGRAAEAEVQVVPGAASPLVLPLAEPGPPWRPLAIGSGLTLAGAGLVLSAWTAAAAAGAPVVYSGGGERSRYWLGSCELFQGEVGGGGDCRRPGFPMLPLGLALTSLGASLALGGWLEESEPPWLGIGAGVVLAASFLALGAATGAAGFSGAE